MKKKVGLLAVIILSSVILSTIYNMYTTTDKSITKEEVIAAQKTWGDAIVSIGKEFLNKGDYRALAKKTLNTLYNFDHGTVLFKPTKASDKQFRPTKMGAKSYFVTGIEIEDHGFAIQTWSKVRFENKGMIIDSDSAISMGNYYFTDTKTNKEAKVEFTFGYIKDESGRLRINVHHSSFPYEPTK
ncbi:MAG: hypothetical protein KAG98_07060 [Lentisphaeria bacterium]|nr:hypothetical protein [Lentisphaeria bacterium]